MACTRTYVLTIPLVAGEKHVSDSGNKRVLSLTAQLVLTVVTPCAIGSTALVVQAAFKLQRRERNLAEFIDLYPESLGTVTEYLDAVSGVSLAVAVFGLTNALVFAAAAAWLARSLASQLGVLQSAAHRMAQGDLETPVASQGSTELSSLSRSLERMRASLRQRIQLEADEQALARDRDVAEAARSLFLPNADRHRRGPVHIEAHRETPTTGGRTLWQHGEAADGSVVVLVAECLSGGTSAALITGVVTTCLRIHLRRKRFDPVKLARAINRTLVRTARGEGELCLDLIHLNPSQSQVHLLSADGAGVNVTVGGQRVRLEGGGSPLGSSSFSVHQQTQQLRGRFEIVAIAEATGAGRASHQDVSQVRVQSIRSAA